MLSYGLCAQTEQQTEVPRVRILYEIDRLD